jgi:hypothetical protein
MEIKRVFSLGFGIIGIIFIFISLAFMQTITGAILGVNVTSKFLGVLGVLFMIVAIFIERYEYEKSGKEITEKNKKKKK